MSKTVWQGNVAAGQPAATASGEAFSGRNASSCARLSGTATSPVLG